MVARPKGRAGRLCLSLALGVTAAAGASAAKAQVMEIGADGAVRTYDGPAVFTDDGAEVVPRPGIPRRSISRSGALAAASEAAGLSPDLVRAVAWRESGGRQDRVSRKGAVGVMQLMPGTARDMGVDASDAAANLRGGALYLNRMLARYDGDLVRALAAYNAGPAAVDRYHGVPPFKETQAYVAAIFGRLSEAVAPLPARPPK